MATKAYLRTSDVAYLLGCSKQYVGKLIRDGRIASHRLNEHGWHRISVNSLRRYAAGERISLDFDLLPELDDSTSG